MKIIKRIRISNFKSFKDVDLELDDLNLIIGSNASGKSNFVQVLKFIKDFMQYGLDSAISIQGGIDELCNINMKGEKTTIEITINPSNSRWIYPIAIPKRKPKAKKDNYIYVVEKIIEATYRLTFQKKTKGTVKAEDSLILNCISKEQIKRTVGKSNETVKEDAEIPVTIKITGRHLKTPQIEIETDEELFPPDAKIISGANYEFIHELLKSESSPPLLEVLQLTNIEYGLWAVTFCDLNPKNAKHGTTLKGIDKFEEDGSNIALLLRNLLRDKKKREEFNEYLHYLIPSISEVKTEDRSDKTVLLKMKETYFKNKYFSGPFLSDGTANIIAMIYAINYTESSLKVIEEPEKSLHPQLIGGVMELMKSASKNSQMIVTTHNPVLARYIDLDSIIILKRDSEGNSSMARFDESDELNKFLLEEIGIGEMMVQGKLGS